MRLHSPTSAVLSAVIFNAIIIPLLIPLALRGVDYKPIGASALLRRNLFVYGFGGLWGIVGESEGIHGLDERVNVDAFHGQVPIWMEMIKRVAG